MSSSRILVGLIFLFAWSTWANMSDMCSQSRIGARGYQFGYKIEAELLDDIWNRYGACHNIDVFVDNSVIETEFSMGNTKYMMCRNEGIVNSMLDKVEDKQSFCGQVCLENGEKAGLLAAASACGAMNQKQPVINGIIDTLKKKPSIGLCSTTHLQACRNAFDIYVNEKTCLLGQSTLQSFKNAACKIKN